MRLKITRKTTYADNYKYKWELIQENGDKEKYGWTATIWGAKREAKEYLKSLKKVDTVVYDEEV